MIWLVKNRDIGKFFNLHKMTFILFAIYNVSWYNFVQAVHYKNKL